MKRTLYRRLHRTVRPFSGPWSSRVATAVLTAPDSRVSRWSPGDGWIELQTGQYWVRPTTGGACRVLVRTFGRRQVGHTEDQDVLLSGVITGSGHGVIADKKHRLYQVAEPGTLAAQPLTADHPAQRYWTYVLDVDERFARIVEHAQDSVDYPLRDPQRPGHTLRTLGLAPACELQPDGRSWVLSLALALSPRLDAYWWDLARCTDVLAAVSRAYQVPHIRLYSRDVPEVTDPLWHHEWNRIKHGGAPVASRR